MLIRHERASRTEHEVGTPQDDERQLVPDGEARFPVLDEPSWLDESEFDEMEAPRSSALRGIWIGIAAAAITFVLVFAIPQWLGWYDVGSPPPHEHRDAAPDAVISSVTARPSAPAPSESAASAPAPPPPRAIASKEKAAAPAPVKEARPSAPARAGAASRDASPAWIQIAAFKSAAQAGRLAARVKHEGYHAEVRRLRSTALPWVVWIGSYASREQAEAARSALARKGFRDSFIR
jgi:cell division septation protein DedD